MAARIRSTHTRSHLTTRRGLGEGLLPAISFATFLVSSVQFLNILHLLETMTYLCNFPTHFRNVSGAR